ncbi:MAG: ABC transporter permease [Vicinamibacterales bacterium]
MAAGCLVVRRPRGRGRAPAVARDGQRRSRTARAAGASGTFFRVLGVGAALGRTLQADDDRAGADPVAVLTDASWHRLFGADPSAVGRTLLLEGRPHTIVGVLPEGFHHADGAHRRHLADGDRGIPRSFLFPGDITAVRDSQFRRSSAGWRPASAARPPSRSWRPS